MAGKRVPRLFSGDREPGGEHEHALSRVLAFVAGIALIILGLGFGVSVVLMPVGIPMAILGVGLIVVALSAGVSPTS